MKEKLIKIGLTANEAEIYLALLKLGESPVYPIVDKTGINRTNIYDCLSRLVDKGFVSFIIKNKKKYFSAANPKRIIDYLSEREKEISEEKEEISKLIPSILNIAEKNSKEKVEVFEGEKGLKTILEEILDSGKDILSYGSRGNMSVLGNYMRHFVKRMSKSNIKAKIIFSDDKERKQFKYKFGEVRYLPAQYQISTETMVYGDEVVIFIFAEETKAIHVKSKVLSDSYRKYFDLLWKQAKY